MTTLPTTLPILDSVVDLSRTRWVNTFERPIAAGVASVLDGMAMVGNYTDPVNEAAAPSAGTGSENFLGTAIVGVVNVQSLPLVEQVVAPTVSPAATVQFTIQRTPISSSYNLYNATSGATISAGVASSSNSVYSISGTTVTVGGLLMGVLLQSVYSYAPTFSEVINRFHQASINFDNVQGLLQQVSIGGGIGSEIYTNFWDSLNGQFTNGGVVKLGVGGKFTAGGGGNTIGVVITAPTATDTTLGFRVTADA